MLDRQLLDSLLTGIRLGNALGATTEFVYAEHIPGIYAAYRTRGWPFRAVGGGWLGLRPGQTTDDSQMAACVAASAVAHDGLDVEDVARRFVDWLASGPPDVGGTVLAALRAIEDGAPVSDAAYRHWRQNPRNAPNGAMMFTGLVPAFSDTLFEAFDHTLALGTITHYGPLPVICGCFATWLAMYLHEGYMPFQSAAWPLEFEDVFHQWLAESRCPRVRLWRRRVRGEPMDWAWRQFSLLELDPDRFSPFEARRLAGRGGYCGLTLEVAAWALGWSLRDEDYPVPDGLPPEVFEKRGARTLGWVPLIGHDADTYGAVAGALFAACYGRFPAEMVRSLRPADHDAAPHDAPRG